MKIKATITTHAKQRFKERVGVEKENDMYSIVRRSKRLYNTSKANLNRKDILCNYYIFDNYIFPITKFSNKVITVLKIN